MASIAQRHASTRSRTRAWCAPSPSRTSRRSRASMRASSPAARSPSRARRNRTATPSIHLSRLRRAAGVHAGGARRRPHPDPADPRSQRHRRLHHRRRPGVQHPQSRRHGRAARRPELLGRGSAAERKPTSARTSCPGLATCRCSARCSSPRATRSTRPSWWSSSRRAWSSPPRPARSSRPPLDQTQPANDLEFFALGQMEVTPKMIKSFQTGAGVAGPYGYIIDLGSGT